MLTTPYPKHRSKTSGDFQTTMQNQNNQNPTSKATLICNTFEASSEIIEPDERILTVNNVIILRKECSTQTIFIYKKKKRYMIDSKKAKKQYLFPITE